MPLSKIIYKNKRKLLIAGIFLTSLIFITKAYINSTSLTDANDFWIMYSLSKIFWNQQDVFELYLTRNTDSVIAPLWTHLTYIILGPYTLFSFKISNILWFISNLIFFVLIIKLIKNYEKLSLNQTFLLTIIALTSTPFTNALGNGQISLLLLLILIIYWNSKNTKYILGLSLIKVSIAPIFIIFSLIKKETDFLYSVAIYAIGVLIYSFYIGNFTLYQFVNPLLIIIDMAETYNFSGISNIKYLFIMLKIDKYYFISISLIMFFLIIYFLKKEKTEEIFLIIILFTLVLFYHNLYDFVLLIPFVSYLIKNNKRINKIEKTFFYSTILFFFYFIRFNQLILNNYLNANTISSLGIFFLFVSSYLLNKRYLQRKVIKQ